MIKHHPTHSLLQHFVDGSLPLSLSVAVSAHIDFCPHCQSLVQDLTQTAAEDIFEPSVSVGEAVDDFSAMIDSIVEDDVIEFPIHREPAVEFVKGQRYELPRSISSIARSKWQGIGNVSRSRLQVDEEPIRVSLLHIDKNGQVPEHTHEGFELTLLLQGDFCDDDGEYQPGDFIWRDKRHQHSPRTKEGCLCLTVVSDQLQFTSGLSKLLNPIGTLIY